MTRTEIRDNYDILHPNYTIFHEDDHTFTDVWTEYTEDFKIFYKNMRDDMENYKNVKAVKAKPGQPQNFYCISMVPWLNFTGYSAYTESGTPMLFPIITCDKFTEHDGTLTMPFCSISPMQPLMDIIHPCLSTIFRN